MQQQAPTVLPKNVRAQIDRVPLNERRRGSNDAYHPEMLSELAELSMSGWSDIEIADHFNVNVRTLHRWANTHAEFAKALQMNDKAAVARVKGAFFAKATGFHYVEQQAIKIKVAENLEEVQVVDVTRYQPPDTTAGIFYLKNRDRANWTDQTDINVTATVDLKGGDLRAVALAMLATMKAGLMAPIIEHETEEKQE